MPFWRHAENPIGLKESSGLVEHPANYKEGKVMHSPLLCTLLLLVGSDATSPTTLRYVRKTKEKFVLESIVTFKKTTTGPRYLSVTHRPGVKLELQIRFDKKHTVQSATVTLHTRDSKRSATTRYLPGKSAVAVMRSGESQKLTMKVPPVLATTAPDWSDILLLLRRYNAQKGGKQEFQGVWFHPVRPAHVRTFVVEQLGKKDITVGMNKRTLLKYRVQLRSGSYFVWADADGMVYKLMPPKRPQAAVFLKGYEEVTQDLR